MATRWILTVSAFALALSCLCHLRTQPLIPKAFQILELTWCRVEQMYDEVTEIQQHPFAVTFPLYP